MFIKNFKELGSFLNLAQALFFKVKRSNGEERRRSPRELERLSGAGRVTVTGTSRPGPGGIKSSVVGKKGNQ